MRILDSWEELAAAPRFVVFDTETTGLDPRNDVLVEIGAVMVSHGSIVASLSTLIQPGRPIPPEAGMVNGITDEMVAHALPLGDALASFEFFIADCPVVAHNATFDVAFVGNALGYPLPNPAFCTAMMAGKLIRGKNRYSLASLCRRFGIVNDQAHRALSDAEATARVALALIALGKNPMPEHHYVVTEANTYNIRETLGQLGFMWSSLEKLWHIYIPEDKMLEAITPSSVDGTVRVYGIMCRKDTSL